MIKINLRKIVGLTGLLTAFLALAGANWAESTDFAPKSDVVAPWKPVDRALRVPNVLAVRAPARPAADRHLAALKLQRNPSGGRSEVDSLPAAPEPFTPTAPIADATPVPSGSFQAPPFESSELKQDTGDASGHLDGYLWIFGGLDAGTLNVSTSATSEENQSGYQIRPKLLGTYYINKDWSVDAGFGWARFSVDTGSKDATVLTRAGFAEIAPKWRPSDRWAVGPVADIYFGTDLSLAESYQSSGTAIFGGLQGQFELPVSSTWRLRLGATLLTTLNVAERQGYTALAGIQIGLPVAHLK